MPNYKHQKMNQVVDITTWSVDQQFGDKYPEGARAKDLLISPSQPPFSFIKSNSRYMFKYSRKDCPEQFWIEILAYRLGSKMGIEIPHTFVAVSNKTAKTASLIEWFYTASETLDYEFEKARLIGHFRKKSKAKARLSEIMYQGGDFCKTFIHNFDEKKGNQHNFMTIVEIMEYLEETCDFEKAWKEHWAKTLLFDALIGNKDRHQNNWGVIFDMNNNRARLSPVFDNGTSMAYRHQPLLFVTDEDIAKYIDGKKSTHHMKWSQDDEKPAGHLELLLKFIARYPAQKDTMLECLGHVNEDDFVEAQKLGFKGYSAFTLMGREGEEVRHYKDLMQSFLSRLPPRKREDFNEYLEGFRIKPDAKLSDFALLGYTSARLPSDSFSILHTFEDTIGPFEFLLEVVVFQSSNVGSGEIRVGQKAEFQKAYDSKHAGELEIMISVSGQQLGYVARGLVPTFSQWMDQGRIQAAFVEKKNGTQDRPVLFLYVEIKN